MTSLDTAKTTVGTLCDICDTKHGNINIVISMLLLRNTSFILFGGILRDFFAKSKSNDIDMIVLDTENTFAYDGATFNDLFLEKIRMILASYGIEITNAVRRIDVIPKDKYFPKTEVALTGTDADKLLDFDVARKIIERPQFKPDHLKYTISVFVDGIPYNFEIDFSFYDDFEMLKPEPAVTQDSLYVRDVQSELAAIFSSFETTLNVDSLKAIEKLIHSNVTSFLPIDVEQVKKQCAAKKLTINNINQGKRALKAARLFSEGWTLSKLSKQTAKVHGETLRLVSLCLIQNSEYYTEQQKESIHVFSQKFRVYETGDSDSDSEDSDVKPNSVFSYIQSAMKVLKL
jgi:hypothetical protein